MAYAEPTPADLRNVLPNFAAANEANMGGINSEPNCQNPRRMGRRPNLNDVCLTKFGVSVAGADLIGAMPDFIRHVFRTGSPAEMLRIDASQMAAPAIVSGFHFGKWGLSMSKDAHRTRSRRHSSVELNGTVSMSAIGKRPIQALGRIVRDIVFKPLDASSRTMPTAQWVAVAKKPSVVRAAKTAGAVRLPVRIPIAAINAACFEIVSHVRSFRDRLWLGLISTRQRRVSPTFLMAQEAGWGKKNALY